MPFFTIQDDRRIDTDIMYDNLVNKYKWGNMDNPNVYLDENSIRMAKTFRMLFGMLAEALVSEGDTVRAKTALDYCLKVIPSYNVPHDYSTNDLAEIYARIGATDQAAALYKELVEKSFKNLNWYSRLSKSEYRSIVSEVNKELYTLQFSLGFFEKQDPELYKRYIEEYEQYYSQFEQFKNQSRQQFKGGRNR
jgi:tetratricopeptide (TPR) repeat protein